MLKKLCFVIFLLGLTAFPAKASEDFSKMLPTVKVTSYKNLFIDQVLPYGSGSGTVVSPDGIIITNHHVIFDDEDFEPLDTFEVCITFEVKDEPVCKYTARLIAQDKDLDIALLKINEKDVFGKTVPPLNFLDYQSSATPREQTEIRVFGYPGSGGKTITITKGQISGFEQFNGFSYFKTDTDFDHGSSGGTAVDTEGNFIGIPTYIRSYAENVGFFLDLREAREWIDQHITQQASGDRQAEKKLEVNLARLESANSDLAFTQENYPYLSAVLPEGWEFLEINDNSFFASQKNLSNPVGLSVFTLNYQYEVGKGYLDKLDEQLEQVKENFPDYKKESVTFAGQKAWKITYTSYSNKNTTYYIPYGYTMVGVSYSIDLDESEKQEKEIVPALEKLSFARTSVKNPSLPKTLSFSNPPFEIASADDFLFQKNSDMRSEDLLADAAQKDNFEGTFALYYSKVPKDERQLSAKERLDQIIKNFSGKKIVFKNDQVVLGGLHGFLFTYEYEGNQYQEIRKRMIVIVVDGDYEFTIDYDDLTDQFDDNLPTVQKILDSFSYKGELSEEKVETSYGSVGSTFNDIQYHRFAKAISDLAEKGIVKGYGDGGFHPEQPVSRIEALKMILESKNNLETEKDSKKIVSFSRYEKRPSDFSDIKNSHPLFKYLDYAHSHGFVKGYDDATFRPDQKVNLAEALSLIIKTYEIPVWNGETDPWFKKYMEKGFELGLIPYGMYEPSHPLTRAELAFLVSAVYKQAK